MIRKQHGWSHLRQDLPAGLVVFLVAVPLCLGIALASGAPLFAGVIAGIVGGLMNADPRSEFGRFVLTHASGVAN